MKKSIVMLMLIFGISIPFGRIWDSLTNPVNCALDYGEAVTEDTISFGKCVWNNLTFNA